MHQNAENLALAIDIGSSSVRSVAFDGGGHQLPGTEHRERYRAEITPDGGSMCDPLRIRGLAARCVQRSAGKLGTRLRHVRVVGVSCHWHSLMGLDATGQPLTPVYMWSDKRAGAAAQSLATELDDASTHARTGCRIHSSYWPAKIRWLQRDRSEVYVRVAQWCGLADWLMRAPGAPLTASISMASATGLMTTATQRWDAPLLHHLGLKVEQLPELLDRGEPIATSDIHPDLVPDGLHATWYPAIGDGAAANIGAGAVGNDGIALTIGTSGAIRLVRHIDSSQPLPPSLFRYLIDRQYEVVGGALSNGGNMMTWFGALAGMSDPVTAMRVVADMVPDNHGLTVLPFFAGERAPSWQDALRGTITGMSLDTSSPDIYRALLEATALRFAQVYDDLKQFTAVDHQIVASGGALLQAPVWCQITADALGHRLLALPTRLEASARGAAISSLQAAGLVPSLRISPEIRKSYTAQPHAHRIYRRARQRSELLEHTLNRWEQDRHNVS